MGIVSIYEKRIMVIAGLSRGHSARSLTLQIRFDRSHVGRAVPTFGAPHMPYIQATIDTDQRHLIGVSVGTSDDPGDICELWDFVTNNIDDPDLHDWLCDLADGKEVRAGGGAFAESVLRPVFQPHIVE